MAWSLTSLEEMLQQDREGTQLKALQEALKGALVEAHQAPPDPDLMAVLQASPLYLEEFWRLYHPDAPLAPRSHPCATLSTHTSPAKLA